MMDHPVRKAGPLGFRADDRQADAEGSRSRAIMAGGLGRAEREFATSWPRDWLTDRSYSADRSAGFPGYNVALFDIDAADLINCAQGQQYRYQIFSAG
jgi:hypothetical protein